MKNKQVVFVYTRINGVEKVKIDRKALPAGMIINREFHEGLGLKVGER
jgi:hypothetical protein